MNSSSILSKTSALSLKAILEFSALSINTSKKSIPKLFNGAQFTTKGSGSRMQ